MKREQPTWRIVLRGDRGGYLVHVPGETKKEAEVKAIDKVETTFHGTGLQVCGAERIEA